MEFKELTQREVEKKAKDAVSQLVKAHEAGSDSLVALINGDISLEELFEKRFHPKVKRRISELIQLEEEIQGGFQPFLG